MQQRLWDMMVASGQPASRTGPKRAVCELGSVQKNGNGWRVQVCFGRDVVVYGPTHNGPAAGRKAEADLAQARQASTREEFQQRLRDMMVARWL